MGIGSNIAAVVALIRYAMCLTTAKFTDKVNVEITLKKNSTEQQRPFCIIVLWGFPWQAWTDRNKLTAVCVCATGRRLDDQASEAFQDRQQDTLPEAE